MKNTDIIVFLVALYALVLLVKTFDFLPNRCPDNGVDVSDSVLRGTGVSSSVFWTSKAFDVIQCWRFCVRRKPCRSLTFNYISKTCNLSKNTLTDGITQAGISLLYSELDWFSSKMEPDCYGRPCGANQVCVPGLLADRNINGCSYACLNVSGPVCPLPEWISGSRTPGSVNTLSCNAWETGGGTATCGKDLKWSATVRRCRPILNLQCQNDAVCAPINAQCRSGRCECGTGMSYNFTDNLCDATPCLNGKYLVNGTYPVPDSQLSVSSVWENNDLVCGVRGTRLHTMALGTNVGSWCARVNDNNQFIQVQFKGIVKVTGIALQGRPNNTDPNSPYRNCCDQYVTSYKFLYSQNCINFTVFPRADGTEMVFPGNTDQNTVVTTMLPHQVTAKCVRINPQTWFGHVSLRFDIIGCY